MENFFNWMTKPIPKDEVIIWFNIHNMNYEKIELVGDIFKTLNEIISDTYLGEDTDTIRIDMSFEDKSNHFEWCWNKLIEDFEKENISISKEGEHKNYLKSFFLDTFYDPKDTTLKKAIPNFIEDVFSVDKPFTKSDLDILTELYQLMEKNVK